VGAGIDTKTGEVITRRSGSEPAAVIAWLQSLPGPVAAYEAGSDRVRARSPTGATSINCFLAPSKVRRASGDRVKTDKRDAELLTRLLLAGDFIAVTLLSVTQELTPDLVHAREDARSDLMTARCRVGKLLLRHG